MKGLASQTGLVSDEAPASSWYALFVMTIVLMFALIDRAVLSLLAEPIKKSLELSDLQLGLMQGTGIAVFTALAGFPLAWLSDRFSRKAVLVGSVVVWSSAVIGCGMATSYEQMLFASAMVGAGEAGLGPITYALIAELFTGRKRQTANSVFVVAGATGGGLAMIATGQLVQAAGTIKPWLPLAWQAIEDWRLSFFLAALPAPLMILLIGTIRQVRKLPQAAQLAGAALAESGVTLLEHLRRHRRTLLSFFTGIGFAIFSFGAIGSWLAVICIRQFGQTPAQIGNALGLISMTAIGAGFVISVQVVRRFGPRLGATLQVRTMWVSTLVATSTAFAMGFATSAQQVYMIQAVQAVLLTTANMLYPTALQELAPAHLRARIVAIQSAVNVSLGAMAAPAVGLLSDRLGNRPDSLLVSASGIAVAGLLVATVMLRWCERGYARTVQAIVDEAGAPRGTPQPQTA